MTDAIYRDSAVKTARVKRQPARLGIRLAVLVAVKLLLLAVAWHLWFSQPLAPHMRVAAEAIDKQFFGQRLGDTHSPQRKEP